MTHMKAAITTLLAGGLLTFALSGFACDDKGEIAESEKPDFDTVDANLDGVITPAEAEETWLAAAFADVDVNQDGLVNRSEYESAIS